MAGLIFDNSDCFIPSSPSRSHDTSNVQWKYNIPTPPNSARSSLESSDDPPVAHPASGAVLKRSRLDQLFQSQTLTPPQVSVSFPSLRSVIDTVHKVADGCQQGCRIDGVTPE